LSGGRAATGFGNSRTGVVLGPRRFSRDEKKIKVTEHARSGRFQPHPVQRSRPGSQFATVGFGEPGTPQMSVIGLTTVNRGLIQFGLHIIF